jgi:hypothetical protein
MIKVAGTHLVLPIQTPNGEAEFIVDEHDNPRPRNGVADSRALDAAIEWCEDHPNEIAQARRRQRR